MIDYSPLWHTMEEKQISQYVLLKSGIDHKTKRIVILQLSLLRNYV